MTTPMNAERFADRYRFYCDQPQQQRGVNQLFEAIGSSDPGCPTYLIPEIHVTASCGV